MDESPSEEVCSNLKFTPYPPKIFTRGSFFGAVGGGNTRSIYFAIAFLVRSIFPRNF